jgi:hypothetical protein
LILKHSCPCSYALYLQPSNIHLACVILHVQVNELNNGIEALHKVQEVLKSNLNKADDEVLLIRY